MTARRVNILHQALEEFEKCLETPIIPGEMPSWMRAAQEACKRTCREVRAHWPSDHQAQLAEIREEDPELASRTQQLRETDDLILQELDRLEIDADRLYALAEKTEPHEARIDQHIETFTESGIAVIIQIRKQEIAIDTWYAESLARDRGSVD